jgi:DNA-binding NtrC family response regulator
MRTSVNQDPTGRVTRLKRLFEQHRNVFNLLLTDVIMPGSSGPELFERLARQRPDLKVLYMSGYTDDTVVVQGQLDAGVELLQKPFTADILNRRVREVLDRRPNDPVHEGGRSTHDAKKSTESVAHDPRGRR